jgi:hypothetical protein
MRNVSMPSRNLVSQILISTDSNNGGRSVAIFLGAGPGMKSYDIPFVHAA